MVLTRDSVVSAPVDVPGEEIAAARVVVGGLRVVVAVEDLAHGAREVAVHPPGLCVHQTHQDVAVERAAGTVNNNNNNNNRDSAFGQENGRSFH